MADLVPFKAIRPTKDKVHLVACRSYLTYKKKILNTRLADNPFSFIHIINPEFGQPNKTKANSKARFQKIKDKYESFKSENIFLKESEPAYYIYNQIKDGNSYYGLICGMSIYDYINNKIKIHEQTITKREAIFRDYLDVCGFNAEPVLITYKDSKPIDNVIQKCTKGQPEYDFTTTDRARHRLWVVDKETDIKKLTKEFKKVEDLYIADGHHRTASSALLGMSRKVKSKSRKKELFESFMCFLIPETQLKVYDYNRLITDMNGLTVDNLIKKLKVSFTVKKHKEIYKPTAPGKIGMYVSDSWYELTVKSKTIRTETLVDQLDAEILNYVVFEPLFGITDLKTDKRIRFIAGLSGMEGIQKIVDDGRAKAGFALFPITTEQIKDVANSGEIMPPKSTWIEPKLRSGLIIYEF